MMLDTHFLAGEFVAYATILLTFLFGHFLAPRLADWILARRAVRNVPSPISDGVSIKITRRR